MSISILKYPFKALRTAYAEYKARGLLGLPRNHSEWDLHVAYRALVPKHHPNLGGDRIAWIAINDAFDVLRKRFDSTTR